ncbi:MAG: CBS domain-containing protein [Saprospiraceae bacterium]|nr:MAG: Cl- channel voltage-gated family protein [Bacteroidetes bacterium OLB9]MCO6463645.1 CBS domain-containing protein [Saprospiraceae bacterium]MCZ2338865.1 CBS domain-containing protein [Chitinophagales bacterium]
MKSTELLNMKVKELMTSDLHTVKQDTLLKEVKNIFDSERIHHIPVVNDNNEFVGIISSTDVMLLLDWGTKLELPSSMRKNNFLLTSNLAKDIMETNVIRVTPEDTIQRCVQIFRENYFRALPVVDKNDHLVGIITTYDLMVFAYTVQGQLHK